MRRKWVLASILAAAFAAIAAAQSAPRFLTNDDIVAMVKGGQGEDAILNAIQSQGTDFDVSAKAVLALKKGGASKKIIDAMIGAVKDQKDAAAAVISSAQAKAAAEEADEKAETAKEEAARQQRAAAMAGTPANGAAMTAAMPGMPTVVMVKNGQKQPLGLAHTQIVPAGSQLAAGGAQGASMDNLAADNGLTKNLASLAQSFAGGGMPGMGGMGGLGPGKPGVASAMMMANPMFASAMIAGKLWSKHKAASQGAAAGQDGGAGQGEVTAVWAIPGAKSETIVHGGQFAFEVQFDGVSGVNADDYEPVLIRLTPSQSNFRLVGATVANPNEFQSSQADWNLYASFVEQRVPAQATKMSSGRYTLQTGSGLAAGEYGVVLRPVNKNKKFSGNSIGQNQGDGLVFNCVWSFEVQ